MAPSRMLFSHRDLGCRLTNKNGASPSSGKIVEATRTRVNCVRKYAQIDGLGPFGVSDSVTAPGRGVIPQSVVIRNSPFRIAETHKKKTAPNCPGVLTLIAIDPDSIHPLTTSPRSFPPSRT